MLAELRNVVAHGKRLYVSTVEPWAAEYLANDYLDLTVRDLVRDVIEQLALSDAMDPANGSSPGSDG